MKLCGIDVGTTSVKAAVFSEDGQLLGYAMEAYEISFPQPGYAEQDGETVWQKAKSALGRAVSQAGGDISAISVSTQGDALLLLDRNKNLLAPVQLGMDYRSEEQVKQLNRQFGEEELFKRTGMVSHPLNFLPKLIWAAQKQPKLFEKVWKAVTYADFFMIRLCGVAGIDSTMASRTMAVNLETNDWDIDLLRAGGIDRDKLSDIFSPGTTIGTVKAELAQELGIPQVPVAAGGHDQVCAALGAGLSREGIGLDSHGTAEVISTALSHPVMSADMEKAGCPCYRYGIPDWFFTFGLNHTGGVSLQHYKELFQYGSYEELMASLPDGPTELLTIPAFQSEGGSMGTVTGLTLSADSGLLCKSLLEGLAFEMRRYLELFNQIGAPVNELRCVGGGARSPAGLQLKADIYGRPVSTLRVREGACLGAALLAGTAVGVYGCVEEGIQRTVCNDKVYVPDKNRARQYEERYRAYCELHEMLEKKKMVYHE